MTEAFDVPRAGHHYHERRNALTPEDAELIKAIVESVIHVKAANDPIPEHDCRFPGVTTGEFMEVIESHRKFNVIMDDSKKTARKFFLVLFLVFITGVLTDGLWSRVVARLKTVVAP